VNFQPFIGKNGDRHWPQDLNNVSAVLDELLGLQAEGYSVIGNKDSFQGFLDYFKAPPSPDNYRHLDLGGEKRNCDIGLRSMFVYPNGDVFFCEYLGKPIGNIYKQSLSDIYYGTAAGEQRSDMVYCDIDCQNTCKRPTPLWVKAKAFIKMG
jgi:MoaA/NifB/PqqE/SkfB family radical SAM enzyme